MKIDDKVLVECVRKIYNLARCLYAKIEPGTKQYPYAHRIVLLASISFDLASEELKLKQGTYTRIAAPSAKFKKLCIS